MEFASKLRWFLVITAMILVLIFVGWGLYSIARSIFRSGSGDSSSSTSSVESDSDYAVDLTDQASLYVDGAVVAESKHRSYSIEVSSSVVTMKVYSGYGQQVIKEKSYRNTSESYKAFLDSLDSLRVTRRVADTDIDDDHAESGVCPSGWRYIVELDDSVRRWSTSCGSRKGTAGFSMSAVRRLFKRQVPDFSEIIKGTGL